jgi:hypothetical protein
MKRKEGLITSQIEFQITEINCVNTSERWKNVVSERKFWIIVQEGKGLLKYLR